MELSNLKAQLPRGWRLAIAEKVGVSKVTVSQTMNGHEKNQAVIDAAIELAEEHKAQERKRIRKIQRLTAKNAAA